MGSYFDEARTYDGNSSEQREDGVNLMNLLRLESGSKVLDLGCGTGYLTKVLASKVGPKGKVVGMDPDRERLQVATEKYSGSNAVYQEGRAEYIPGSGYDVVFSNSVLHWCEDKDKVFKEVAKSLKKGGKFGFVVPNDFDIAEQFCTPEDMLSPECRQHIINSTHLPSLNELCTLSSDNGFVTIYMKEHIRDWKFGDASELIQFYMTHFNELGGEHYNLEAMKRHYGEGEIVFKMPYTTVVLVK